MVPTVLSPPATPSTDQFTEVFEVNCCVRSGVSTATFGEMVTLFGGAVTVTAADADFVVSAALVAFTVCEPAADGAVYKPVVLTVPTVELPPATPSTDHVTAVFELFVTVAVNCCVPPVAIVALV